jgi:hypothetical protein
MPVALSLKWPSRSGTPGQVPAMLGLGQDARGTSACGVAILIKKMGRVPTVILIHEQYARGADCLPYLK